MDIIGLKPLLGKPPGQISEDSPEPVRSSNSIRKFLGTLKGCSKIDAETLETLVTKQHLPFHYDPFGTGRWVFLESEVAEWFQSRLEAGSPRPVRGPGRPRKIAA